MASLVSIISLLSLATFGLTLPTEKADASTGTLRLYQSSTQLDSGCVTNDWKWTKDESQCGTFTITDEGDYQFYSIVDKLGIKSGVGACTYDWNDYSMTCEAGATDDDPLSWYYHEDDGSFINYGYYADGFNSVDGTVPSGSEAVAIHGTNSQWWAAPFNNNDYQMTLHTN